MASDPALIGKRYPTQIQPLTQHLVEGYAAATDDANPRYQGSEALAPPLVVVTTSIPHGVRPAVSDEALIGDPSRLLRLLHGEEDIRWQRALHVGDVLHTTAEVKSIETKSSGELVVIGTQIMDDAGQLVAETASSLFIRNPGPRGLKKGKRPEPEEHGIDFEAQWTVAADQSLRYAEISGDDNPIHTDDAIAKAAGLRGRILHGLCTMAFVQRTVIDLYCDGDPARLRRLKVRFAKPVYMGDTLTCAGWVVERSASCITLGCEVHNHDGQRVLQDGVAEVLP